MKPVQRYILGVYDKELRRSLTEIIQIMNTDSYPDESLQTLFTFFNNLDKSIMDREYKQKVSDGA